MLLTGSLLVKRCPDYTEATVERIEKPIRLKHALRSVRFWHLFILLYNGMFFGVYVASVYKEVGLKYIDDSTLTTAGAIASFLNGSSRIIWGTL